MPPRYLTGLMLGALASLVVSDVSPTRSVSALSADAQAGPTAQTGGQEPLALVAQASLRVGIEVPFPKGFCRFIDFNSGNDECSVKLLPAIDAGGEKHLFGVYRPPSGNELIILLAHRTDDEGYFYRTTTRANLVKAVHAGKNGALDELSNSAVSLRFNQEVVFWRSREGQFK